MTVALSLATVVPPKEDDMELADLADKLRMGIAPVIPTAIAHRLGDELRELIDAKEDIESLEGARDALMSAAGPNVDNVPTAVDVVVERGELWTTLVDKIGGLPGVPDAADMANPGVPERLRDRIARDMEELCEIRLQLVVFGVLEPGDDKTGTLDLIEVLLPGRDA